jgi:hypothetical protein
MSGSGQNRGKSRSEQMFSGLPHVEADKSLSRLTGGRLPPSKSAPSPAVQPVDKCRRQSRQQPQRARRRGHHRNPFVLTHGPDRSRRDGIEIGEHPFGRQLLRLAGIELIHHGRVNKSRAQGGHAEVGPAILRPQRGAQPHQTELAGLIRRPPYECRKCCRRSECARRSTAKWAGIGEPAGSAP